MTRWIARGASALVILALGGYFLGRDPGPSNRDITEASASPEASSPRRMIVVLPFENLGAADDEYFADGMTEEITSRLAAMDGLGVPTRSYRAGRARSG